jgi:uncharacterized protein (DUF2147 family)
MKNLTLLMVFVFISLNTFAQNADAVVGKWMNKDKEAHIQISKKGNKYFGKLVWLKNPTDDAGKAKKDVNNPKSELQGRALLGLEILKNFIYDDGVWQNGTIYDPKSGKTYSCKMTLNGNKLNVRGFIGVSLLGRTDTWTRVN